MDRAPAASFLAALAAIACTLRLLALAALLALGLGLPPAAANYAAVVIDAETGQVYHAANADARNPPASLAKMMTLYLVFEALESGRLAPDQRLAVSSRAAAQAPSRLGLKPGEAITVEQAILALITKSANDAASVVAEALGKSESRFAQRMTERARALGLKDTTFRNASGLPNRAQVTTARDMATLARALIRDFPQRYRYFATKSFRFRGRSYDNHNGLLGAYDGVDGIKTGYIRASGFNLVASAERDGRRLIGVVMGGRTPDARDRQMTLLLDRSFEQTATVGVAKRTDLRRTADTRSAAPAEQPQPQRQSPRPTSPQAAAEEPAANAAWGIQVGAFSAEAAARRAVARARREAPKLLRHAVERIDAQGAEAETLYRARLLGVSERAAKRACTVLKRKGRPCVPLAPADRLATAAP
ncbi:MAG: D-alanyl-D-alanine carboxypeptidase [Proteobacteria bacterium]|nr:D-alanyl-D-alanine carboxypeptidase [Pseudomonadota bacterium]